VNYCADQQPELLGGRGYDLANDFAVYQRALHPRNEDEHPSFDYFSADNPLRRARLDMRNDRVHWDPLRDVAKVAALVHRDPVEPYSKAVEFMNQRFALLIGPPTRQLLVKSRVMGRDLTGYNITLERVSDPAKFFAETCDYKMLNMPSDARNQQLFPANPDAKNPKAWNWFDWYLEHRLGVQRVTSVVFRPLEKGEESPDDVLNIWQGTLGTSQPRADALQRPVVSRLYGARCGRGGHAGVAALAAQQAPDDTRARRACLLPRRPPPRARVSPLDRAHAPQGSVAATTAVC